MTWKDYNTVTALLYLCETHGLKVTLGSWGDKVAKVSVDSNRHPEFSRDNVLYLASSPEEALAWMQGFVAVMWSSKLNKGK